MLKVHYLEGQDQQNKSKIIIFLQCPKYKLCFQNAQYFEFLCKFDVENLPFSRSFSYRICLYLCFLPISRNENFIFEKLNSHNYYFPKNWCFETVQFWLFWEGMFRFEPLYIFQLYYLQKPTFSFKFRRIELFDRSSCSMKTHQ